ncbi:putative YkwD family protein [Bacillus tianshenii]|uniref:YkwD family protein n=1 Tax=Sutcliffiella tianshenii TaxID=1463404 RepID=A0ABS2NX96_9BACI|nr:CAP domain-containing protein [Bacillus tianshenii]MBM7619249.1 putative YkwD family protein [Bacillus tianshenii]
MKKLLYLGSVIALTLSMLVACGDNNNNMENNAAPENTSYNNPLDDTVRNIGNDRNVKDGVSGEVQKINNGFLTIDPNSFSTSTPSNKFPHSQKVEQYGQFGVYKFQQEVPKGEQPRTPQGQPAPEQGQPAPAQEQPEAQPEAKQDQAPAAESTEGISETEQKVIELTNAERRKNGLSDLKADSDLSNVAREKSKDMKAKNYFSHTSPTYGSPFDMMRDFGISYNTAGENIAMGQRSPEEVVQAWMNSEGHRKNILNGNFTHIGVGYVEDGNYWTQMFIGK